MSANGADGRCEKKFCMATERRHSIGTWFNHRKEKVPWPLSDSGKTEVAPLMQRQLEKKLHHSISKRKGDFCAKKKKKDTKDGTRAVGNADEKCGGQQGERFPKKCLRFVQEEERKVKKNSRKQKE